MIDAEHPIASWFILVSAVFFGAVYAVPLLIFPLRWARWLRWPAADEAPALTVYLGRCTGALSLAIIAYAWRAVADPRGNSGVFELIAVGCGLMTLVHVWGAVRRAQPWTETAEILLYGVATAAAVWIRLSLA